MTPDLFLAILAMDAYNRTGSSGTPRGLVLPNGTMLGNATVLSGAGGVGEDTVSGFFAQAYRLSDGTKVISYRGTDFFGQEASKDVLNGWPIGAGITVTVHKTVEVVKCTVTVILGRITIAGNLLLDCAEMAGSAASQRDISSRILRRLRSDTGFRLLINTVPS